eukprot:3088339-Prymnesium_polylepis.1
MPRCLLHGPLEKRPLGKSISTRNLLALAGWKDRHLVLFPTQVSWFEKATTDEEGNVKISGAPLGSLVLGPGALLFKNLDSETNKYWTFGVQESAGGSRLMLKAPSETERTSWTDALERAIDALQKGIDLEKEEPTNALARLSAMAGVNRASSRRASAVAGEPAA